MSLPTTRRHFMVAGAGAALLGLAPRYSLAQETIPPVHPIFPRQDTDAVREVVTVSHFNFDRVKELVTARPALAKAAWDGGYGDWETALGAASHTGQREIASFLMDNGARPDIFTFTMLGHLDTVRAMIEAHPGVQKIPGPHGITLLAHARTGLEFAAETDTEKARANELVEYLESLGDADIATAGELLKEEAQQPYLGRYEFGKGADEYFLVERDKKGNLVAKRADQGARGLRLVEEHAFAPVGAPAVRIRFEVFNGRATSLTVHDPMPLVRAMRVE